MAKFTNYTPGPKGVRTVNGLVFIAPGQTSEDLDVSEGELKAAKATGWFSKAKDEEAQEPAAEPKADTKPAPKAGA